MTETTPADRRAEARTWYGYLAADNLPTVEARIRALIGDGQRYTFVAVNRDQPTCSMDVRTGQRVKNGGWTDGTKGPMLVHHPKPGAEHPFWGLTVSDTYGVWGMHTSFATEAEADAAAHDEARMRQATYVTIEGRGGVEGGKIEVCQHNGSGELLHWVIAVETPEED